MYNRRASKEYNNPDRDILKDRIYLKSVVKFFP